MCCALLVPSVVLQVQVAETGPDWEQTEHVATANFDFSELVSRVVDNTKNSAVVDSVASAASAREVGATVGIDVGAMDGAYEGALVGD